MEKFYIEGGVPLRGEITPGGNKNAALPLMAACLLTNEPVILKNIPNIQDVQTMRKLFVSLGVEFTEHMENSGKKHSANRA
jgi:UDP-N-acetylglucosamine 1-carboxyvinyltransferase